MSQDKEELMRDEDKKKDLRNKIETTSKEMRYIYRSSMNSGMSESSMEIAEIHMTNIRQSVIALKTNSITELESILNTLNSSVKKMRELCQ